MTNSIKNVEKIALVNKEEAELLDSVQKPIVLLKRSKNFESYISSEVIKGLPEIGVMLPYTPVQAILLNDLAKVGIKYVVMTSGNIYDNPIVTKDKEAYRELKGVADAFVGNDREISARYDDSVVRIIKAGDSNAIQMIRRARGYAPVPIKAQFKGNDEVFSTGAEKKNTMSYLRSAEDKNTDIFTSAHIGDVENLDVFTFWDETRLKLEKLFKFKPNILVRDLHSEYLTSK
jgi:hydrogenase maturation protein HypF